MELDKPTCMKMRMSLVLVGALVLAACGADKALEALGREPAAVDDEGISYPRTFDASVELHDGVRGIGRVRFLPQNVDSVFGCSEGRDGEFVFYMKSADDQFKMTFKNLQFRESLTTYTDLVEVKLAGRILGASFDRAKQDYQLDHCEALNISRVGDSLRGILACFKVGSLESKNLATLSVDFSCNIVGR
jgi:hypothetical protein